MARIDSQCGARWPLEALGSLWFYVLNILLLYLLANQLLQVPVFGYLASLRPSVPAECPPNGPLSGGTGRPPKAKAKEAAAKAEAKAAVASVPGLSLCSSLDRASELRTSRMELECFGLGSQRGSDKRAGCLPHFRCQQCVRGSQRS